MNLSGKEASSGDKKLTSAKLTLNPNATEFVPFALRSQARAAVAGSPGKSILDRSESSVSKNSDEEAHQYWRHQLPDDITPDFNITGLDNSQEINGLSFSSLSLTDVDERSRYAISSYGEYSSPTGFQGSLAKPWDKQVVGSDWVLAREEHSYNGNSRSGFLADTSNEQILMENEDLSPLDFLVSQFPGFAAESLADVYSANGGDLNLTIEMLTQLELQVDLDGGLNQTLNSKASSAPNLSDSDFPALSVTNGEHALEKDSARFLRSFSYIPLKGATDFASAVRKTAPQDSSIWKYDKKSSSDTISGSSRGSQVLGSSYSSGQGRGIFGNTVQNQGPARASPVWLETGEAVANMYSEMREEAREHARIRNAYFEQARQAYLIGNKSLAKELSSKGQMHNMQMKAAHEKAQESIYRQRNTDVQANGRERMIDLHGLHVSEALRVLKRELAVLRNAARSADGRLLVYICVGTGHHTRGSRTPARLPVAVQSYLLEEEGLDYSEPQPGLLRVVIF